MPRLLALFASFLLLSTAARGQEILFESDPNVSPGWLSGIADLTGDGRPELVHWTNLNGSPDPLLRVYSGQTLLFERPIPPTTWTFKRITDAGDVDGDGTADLLILTEESGGPRHFQVASGVDGSWIVQNVPASDQFSALGDVDGDGRSDVIYRTQAFGGGVEESGYVIVSLIDQRIIRRETVSGRLNYATSVGAFDDYDGDGVSDYFVTDGCASKSEASCLESIQLHSGRDGSVLQTVRAVCIGTTVRIHDLDGDGISDFASDTSVIGASQVTWELSCFSSQTGQTIVRRELPFFDRTIRNIGDLNGDGASELASFQAFGTSPDLYQTNTLRVLYQPSGQVAPFPGARAAGDQNGDGFDDLALVGFDDARNQWFAWVIAGNDTMLSMETHPPFGALGQFHRLSMTLVGAEPSALARIVLREVGGRPLVLPLTPWASLDANRALTANALYPPSLVGLIVGLQGWTLTRSGPALSAIESIEL